MHHLGNLNTIVTKRMKMAICCPWMSRKHRQKYDEIDDSDASTNRRGATEASSLLRNGDDSLVDAYIASYRSWEDDVNLWSDPYDVTHTNISQDRELDGLIRDWRKATTNMEKKVIYDKVQAIRRERKLVRDRWQKVLEKFGFASQAEHLVSISGASGMTQPLPPSDQALNLHHVLVYQTDIFGDTEVQDRRYGLILDRLIEVDIADDFVVLAKKMYPKEPEGI
ncbi:melanoregulin-like isoform X2 [Lytechinus variegatus]|uniref:melanoregulin-like isoform X2 n=1 Tax=Lytechinus variegatus TaxID=7654 RepID=UPI001BB1626C|nr:melanoregulin-like isoform X2 [Lytechinus variegatus]